MIDASLLEFMIVCNSILLVFLLLAEVLDCAEIFLGPENSQKTFSIGYSDVNGPHTWHILFPESNGTNQSPINIIKREAIVMESAERLRWSGYQRAPSSVIIANLNNTVVLSASWDTSHRPFIRGGPLQDTYDFCSMVFHWGQSNEEGSEHTIDYVRYPMELQVVHIKQDLRDQTKCTRNTNLGEVTDAVAIVSFLFEITEADNPYLDLVVTNLWRIRDPCSKAYIPSFPLQWIANSFGKNYYAYSGSLTQPPCSEIVTWMIQSEPIPISLQQLNDDLYMTFGPEICFHNS